jgi:hypothetical protein
MDVLRGAITRIGDPSTLRLESGKSNIQWKSLYEFFMMHNDLLATIERIAIFDCCNAGAAVRSVSETTSKLIAPRGKHTVARNRCYNSISFTQRLCRAIRNLATEKAYMSSEEIIAEVSRLHYMWILQD